MGNVHFKTTSDIKDLERDYQKLQKQVATLTDELAKVRVASDKADAAERGRANSMLSGIQKQILGLGALAAGYISVSSAINTVNAAIDHNNKQAETALRTQRSIAATQQEAIKNSVALSTLQVTVPGIARRTGFPSQSPLIDAFSAAASSGAPLRTQEQAVELMARLNRQTPEGIASQTGRLLDIRNVSGLESVKANQAFVQSIGEIARIEDPSRAAGAVAKALAGVGVQFQDQDREELLKQGGALFATLTTEKKDITGEQSITTFENITKLLEKARNEGLKVGGKTRRLTADTLFGGLKELAADPALLQAFAQGDLNGDNALVRSILQPDKMSAINAKALQMSFDPKLVDEKLAEIDTGTPQLRRARMASRLEGAVERIEAGSSAADAAIVQKALSAAGEKMPFLKGLTTRVSSRITRSPETAIATLEGALQDIEAPEPALGFLTAAGGGTPRRHKKAKLTEEEQLSADLFRELISTMKEMQVERRTNAAAAQRDVHKEN